MTARRSPHYAAVRRAQVRRRASQHHKRSAWEGAKRWYERLSTSDAAGYAMPSFPDPGLAFRITEGRAAAAALLRDPPKDEEQKASRWRKIWGERPKGREGDHALRDYIHEGEPKPTATQKRRGRR